MELNEDENSGLITVVNSHPYKKILYIIGEVNESVASNIIKELLEVDWDAGQTKEIHLYITSQGGYLADCFAITDLLLHIKEKNNIRIYTYGLGEIASAGFFIFIAGDERMLFPSCRVFVHTHITTGDDRTYEERVKADKTEEKEVYNNYVRYTASQLGLSIAVAKKLLKKSKWLSTKEIRRYNIIKGNSNETSG
jgi:ATP-dependent protease ClpP protease subunit